MAKRILFMVLLGSCAFAGGMAAVVILPHTISQASAQYQARLQAPIDDTSKLGERFESVARQVGPAVVAVEASKPAAAGEGGKKRSVEEAGSGVIISLEGRPGFWVLTNNHVIANARPDQITINLADGRLATPRQVWADPESDVAILRIDGLSRLTAARLGDSDRMKVGQWVLAFGSPFGLNQTVTHGIISARERGQVSLGSTIRIKDFLQTDAAINPGSSGGPLVSLDGEVIGLNTAIASQSGSNSGVAFSIPINLVKRVVNQLLDRGSVSRGYLGLQVAQSFEPADARKLGLDRVQGALIEAVYPNTPAAKAGLRANDVLLYVDGQPIRNENHLINYISTQAAGQRIRLQVWRARKTLAVEAEVGDWTRAKSRFDKAQ